MGLEGDVRGWLRARGAETIAHPGGTLYTHLSRVHDRLAALGSGPDLRLAGLAHASYGTDGFGVALLGLADRPVLRELIGGPAEAIVYCYGAADRGLTWRQLATTGQVWDRFTGQPVTPDPADLRSFVDLCIINELDIVEQDLAVAERYGDYFRSVFGSWAGLASPAVRADADRVLATRPAP
jgi:hypothetical protein